MSSARRRWSWCRYPASSLMSALLYVAAHFARFPSLPVVVDKSSNQRMSPDAATPLHVFVASLYPGPCGGCGPRQLDLVEASAPELPFDDRGRVIDAGQKGQLDLLPIVHPDRPPR